MTLAELKMLLETTRLSVAFDHFPTAQELPYMVYIVTDNNIFPADNGVYDISPQIQVELYTELKDEGTEAIVETALNSVPFVYAKEEGYLTDERMYMVTYRFTLR